MSTDQGQPTQDKTLRRALLALRDIRSKYDALQRSHAEPIAVVGMSCRMPGGIHDAASCWDFLREGRDGIQEIPANRWAVDDYFDPDPDAPGRMYCREGGFLDTPIDQFDAGLFSISRREAKMLDPQHRFLLELSWEALEDAGYAPSRLAGTDTGVFVGISSSDYTSLMSENFEYEDIDPYCAIGTAAFAASGRIAHTFGFEGPALSVDTACSSSLVSIHLAMEALRRGESRMALACGVNMILSPLLSVYFSKLKALGKDGRCKTFDIAADGYGRSEGCGVLVLKKMADALSDGDRIEGLLLGSAVNHDGRSGGLTVPSAAAQERVIRAALDRAGVAPADVSYIEAHGTGTPLGDPIEIRGITQVFGPQRPPDRPLWVGSVKSNLGHMEAGAGIGGVVKALLATRHRQLPANLNFQTKNPNILHEGLDLRIPTQLETLPADAPAIAGVSSFGITGTNAHVIVAAPPVENKTKTSPEATLAEPPHHILTLSARTPDGLEKISKQYIDALHNFAGCSFADFCFTSNEGRSHFQHRIALVARTAREARKALISESEGLLRGNIDEARPPNLMFLFANEATDLHAVGRALFAQDASFKAAFHACQKAAAERFDLDLIAALVSDTSPLERGDLAGLLTGIRISAAEMWIKRGVVPSNLCAFGLAEIAAAQVAGLMTRGDALELAQCVGAITSIDDQERQDTARSFARGIALQPLRYGLISGTTGDALDAHSLSVEHWVSCARENRVEKRPSHALERDAAIVLSFGNVAGVNAELGRAQVINGIDPDSAAKAAAHLWANGVSMNWSVIHKGHGRQRAKLPLTPFERQVYWFEDRTQKPKKAPSVGPDLYQVEWQDVPVEEASCPSGDVRTVIVAGDAADDTKNANALQDALERAGNSSNVLIAHQGDALLPDLKDALSALNGHQTHIVFCLPKASAQKEESGDNLCHQSAILCAQIVDLFAATEQLNLANPAKIFLVTCNAVATPDLDANHWNSVHAPVWGLGRVMRNEYPALGCVLLDLDQTDILQSAETAAQEILLQRTTDNEIAVRGYARLAPRLKRTPKAPAKLVTLDPNGHYLITGGVGGVGAHLVDWLIKRGAQHITLASRRGVFPDTLDESVQNWARSGAAVRVVSCDMRQRADVARVLHDMRTLGPIKGILHAAGVLDDGVASSMTALRFQDVLAPKVGGAWNLSREIQADDLDWVVHFSSVTGLLGVPGQANYAAANAWLDGQAQASKARTISIAWGPWENTGMAAQTDGKSMSARHGVRPLTPQDALELLDRALMQEASYLVALNADWDQVWRAAGDGNKPPILRSMVDASKHVQKMNIDAADAQVAVDILGADASLRLDIMTRHLQERLAKVLGVKTAEVAPTADVLSLGLDSLMIMELIQQLKQDLGCQLYPREVMEHPRLDGFAAHLIDTVFGERHVAATERDTIETPLLPAKAIAPTPKVYSEIKKKLPSAVFLLCAPRSGSTLLRVMLAGHPKLFVPPELHLVPFETMASRRDELAASYLGEGLQRAFMELKDLDTKAAAKLIDQLCGNDTHIQDVYRQLQDLAGGRMLIDKSPTYGADLTTLERIEALFARPRYIHLVRHPVAVIDSFARMRMDQLIGASGQGAHQIGENVWTQINRNIEQFSAHLDQDRICRLSYEDLVSDPQAVLKDICQFLDVPFDPAVLTPYSGDRMTDGVSSGSSSIGDPGFSKRKIVDASLAQTWRKTTLPMQLTAKTREIAHRLGYELPSSVNPKPSEYRLQIGELSLQCQSWGDKTGDPVLLLHGLMDQGAAWRDVAEALAAQGFYVVVPDQRGHGRSDHAAPGTAYHLMDFVTDADAILTQFSGKVTLVGHSMGTAVALLLASARSDRIRQLILIEPPDLKTTSRQSATLTAFLDHVAQPPCHGTFSNVGDAAKHLRQNSHGLSEDLSNILAGLGTRKIETAVQWRWDARLKTRAGIAFGQDLPAGVSMDSLLAQLQMPVMAVFGQDSVMTDEIAPDALATVKPDARIEALPGGHNLHFDAPVALANLIAAFADRD